MSSAKEEENSERAQEDNHETNGKIRLSRAIPATVQVVISHFAGRRFRNLVLLLDSLDETPAGWPYQVRVVVNRTGEQQIRLPKRLKNVEVLYRDNLGNNVGAWDTGWRAEPSAQSYLFLQDECRLVRGGWARAFVEKATEKDIGLVGERINPRWSAPWTLLQSQMRGIVEPGHVIDGKPADRVDCYLHFLGQWGIDPGNSADHLQTLVLFARREVLEAIGSFPVGSTQGEAIAAEIGISKKVEALGLKIAEVGPEPIWYFRHPAWRGVQRESPPRSQSSFVGPRTVARRYTKPSSSACTILTPTYNKASFLTEAARSVEAQTHSRWEWWLVLDGPDAETLDVAHALSRRDPRIHVFHEPTTERERQSVYRPAIILNQFYAKVETPYLCWLSDDDLLEPHYLELLIGEIESTPNVDVAYGACEVLTQTVTNQWRHLRWLMAEQPVGVGTTRMPDRIIDGGQIVQTKRSYDALQGYLQPTDWKLANHVDGIYLNELARHFIFVPVFEKVMTKRCTYLSTHVKGEGGKVRSVRCTG